jgi:hypothetical protein
VSTRSSDEVLRRMLASPPKPHDPTVKPKPAPAKKKAAASKKKPAK